MMMTRQLRLSISVLSLLLSLCPGLRGQSESTQPKNPSEPASGVITGKVVTETGQPVAGASLFIRPVNSAHVGRSSISDPEGNFRFGGLEPALYNISATAPAYALVSGESETQATYYRLGDNVRLELVRGGAITGKVTNTAGEPVIAVRVRATMIPDAGGQAPKSTPFSLNERLTDDRGVYRIWGLVPGTYLVSAGGSSLAQGFQFNPYDSDSPTFAPSSTRDTASEVIVRSGEDNNADIRYRGEPGYVVSGTVKTNSQNAPAVNLAPVGAGSMPIAVSMPFPGSEGFAFRGIGDGDYDLVAQEVTPSLTSSPPLFALSDSKRITVKGGDVTGIELITKPLPSLSGRITLEPSEIPECQGKRPPLFAETVVQLKRPEKEMEKDRSSSAGIFGLLDGSASPDRAGAFTVRSLLPGRYQFEPRFYARYWYLKSITSGAAATTSAGKTDAAANWTVIKSGDQISNITITLSEGAASIKGKLKVAKGAPAPAGSSVFLVPAEPDKAEDVLRFFVTGIEWDGTFALSNLPPGKYFALAQVANDLLLTTPSKLRQPESAAARTKLRRTAEAQKNALELKPCQNLAEYQIELKN
jgi:hypothetical protein